MSSELKLLTTRNFNGVALDCYTNGNETNGDFWATREQIGLLLEYDNPNNAITIIHKRNADRLNKFSTSVKLTQVEGSRTVTREVIVYNFKGLLEICRFSNQPKANAVMDFLWDVADEIRRKGFYVAPGKQVYESVEDDEADMKYISRGIMSSAAKIFDRAFNCKDEKDYKLTLALDKIFKDFTGKSALETAGIRLKKTEKITTHKIPKFWGTDNEDYEWDEVKTEYGWESDLLGE